MNKDWNYGILDDAVVKGSSNISLNKIKEEVGDYPVFGAKGFMKNVSFYQQEKEYLGIIKDGAGIGRVSKYPAKSSILATMQYIIPKEDYEIDFVRYFLEGLDFENYRTGSTIPHIYYKDYKTAKFPLVDISEQKQIVAILDKAFSAIDQAQANIEKNIANAKELFQSKLNAIFSHPSTGSGGKANTEPAEVWEEKTLGEVCETSAGGTPLKSHKEYYENGNIPWIRSGEVNNRNIQNSEIKITQQGLDNSSAKLFPTETVVIAMYGATAGQVGILKFECSTNQAVCGIYPNEKYVPEFLYYYFIDFKEKLVAQAVGNAQPNISQKKIKDTIIPVIQIEEQIKIVEELDAINEDLKQIESHYQQKLENLEDLKKSILQKAFAGELTQKEVLV